MEIEGKERLSTLRILLNELGYDNTLKLTKLLGGNYQYIPKADKLLKVTRNEEICRKYNGYNLNELAKEYNLTPIQIRNICQGILKVKKKQPIEGQMSLL